MWRDRRHEVREGVGDLTSSVKAITRGPSATSTGECSEEQPTMNRARALVMAVFLTVLAAGSLPVGGNSPQLGCRR